MIQCSTCEFGTTLPNGRIGITCDPLSNIKEPECLSKWMLVRLGNIERMQAHMVPL